MSKKLVVKLRDTFDELRSRTKIKISVEKRKLGLLIHPQGMATHTDDEDCPSAPIVLEQYKGKMRLLVWGDINREDPTDIIDLSGALESNRKDEEDNAATV
jgi:hypothetical protein